MQPFIHRYVWRMAYLSVSLTFVRNCNKTIVPNSNKYLQCFPQTTKDLCTVTALGHFYLEAKLRLYLLFSFSPNTVSVVTLGASQ